MDPKEQTRRERRAAVHTQDLELSLLADISALIGHAPDATETLPALVRLIADRLGVDVCSLYLVEEELLVLRATHGLDPASVGGVRMRPSEGLTGLTIEQMKAVAVEEAPLHPRFKYFPETKEELFHSFLGVPLVERGQGLGVLVIQTRRARRWTRAETLMMATVASQVVGVVRSATLRERLDTALRTQQPATPARGPETLRGTPAVPGFARGRVFVHAARTDLRHLQPEPAADPEHERARLALAFERSVGQVRELHAQLQRRLAPQDAAVFHAHLMLLQDRSLRGKIDAVIGMRQSAAFAVKKVVHDYLQVFEAMADPYLRERAADLEDLGRRLLENLGEEEAAAATIPEGAIVLTLSLDPSLAAHLSACKAAGVATVRGGASGHGVILARSLGLPTVVGVDDLLDRAAPGDEAILDGTSGSVYLRPAREVAVEYEKLEKRYRELVRVFEHEPARPGALRDGTRIELAATLGLAGDLEGIRRHHAEAVGLYRTEFPFVAQRRMPTEDEQHGMYRRVLEGANGLTVTIRTLDVGGDKPLSYLQHPHEENPALGLRGVRLMRRHPEILRTQLAAILRASAHGPLRILVPMVAGPEDWRWVRGEYRELVDRLRRERKLLGDTPLLGAMVEVPSAVVHARTLAAEADFLSLGTSDLTQYYLAVDRNNRHVADLFDSLDPVVLCAVRDTLAAAAQAGIPASVCGELAGNPLGAPIAVGLGARGLVTDANRIPVLKGLLGRLDLADLGPIAAEACSLQSGVAVRQRMLEHLRGLKDQQVDQALDVLLPGR